MMMAKLNRSTWASPPTIVQPLVGTYADRHKTHVSNRTAQAIFKSPNTALAPRTPLAREASFAPHHWSEGKNIRDSAAPRNRGDGRRSGDCAAKR